jgi:hypothetical protein
MQCLHGQTQGTIEFPLCLGKDGWPRSSPCWGKHCKNATGLKAESSITLANTDPSSSARFPRFYSLQIKDLSHCILLFHPIYFNKSYFHFSEYFIHTPILGKYSFSNLAFRDLYIYST